MSTDPGGGSQSAVSALDELEQVKAHYAKVVDSPTGRRMMLQAVRDIDVHSGFAKELATESIRKLPAGVIEQLRSEIGDGTRILRERLSLIAMGAFAIVLVGSFFTIAAACISLANADRAVAIQVLVTMFTTSVGFLSGLFTLGTVGSSGSRPDTVHTVPPRQGGSPGAGSN